MIYFSSKDINENEVEIYPTITLHKSIFKILQIFSNMYSRKNSEEERIDEFLSLEVTKLLQSIGEDTSGPAQKNFPDSLKEYIQRYVKESKNDNFESKQQDLGDLK